jgi:spore germination cell wall hydrolase CwlJ-like protein
MIAQEARELAGASGAALCIGAGLEFLTGDQKRAPHFLRASGLEWAHRLATNPRRLWRRYLIDGMRIFPIYFRWRSGPAWVVVLGIALIAALGLAAAYGIRSFSPREQANTASVTEALPPTSQLAQINLPPPNLLKPLTPDEAAKANEERPFVSRPDTPAARFVLHTDPADRERALNCLTQAVYYEAAGEGADGGRAVAQVVLNRMRHPGYPASVCGVVYQGAERPSGCQFTFTCDGSLAHQPDADGWRRAWKVAEDALSGSVYAPVGWATHYHANYVLPTWASSMAKNAIVGAHLFYRWAGSWGQAAAFADHYAGREPNAAALRTAALAVPHVTPVYGQQGQLAKAIEEIPGAEAIKLAPSMRGDKRVAVRFNLVARKAADEAPHEDYAQKFETSDNLKWALSGDAVGEKQQPLGKATASTSPASGTAIAGAQR